MSSSGGAKPVYILSGLVVGAALGVAANHFLGPDHQGVDWTVRNIAQPAGQVFLKMLFMVVVPLVFCSITLGVAGLGNLKQLGRVGGKTLAYFALTTAFAAMLGIGLVNVLKPGKSVSQATAAALQKEFSTDAGKRIEQANQGPGFSIQMFVDMIPKNVVRAAATDTDTIGVIFFAIMAGLAATFLSKERAAPFLGFLDGLYEICVIIIGFAMKLAPIGVAGLIFSVTAKFGFDLIKSLGFYLVTVMSGLLIWQFVGLSICASIFGGVSPLVFLGKCRTLMITAFSTSSSNATLPTTIRTAQEEFGVPPKIAGFVLPLGATMNMNGTALFEGVTVLFLAQIAGVDLSLGDQIVVVILAVLTAIGAAGVPGGSLPLLALVLLKVGVDPSMLAIILGVDRIVDMTRTVPNVCGDLTAALFIARTEKP